MLQGKELEDESGGGTIKGDYSEQRQRAGINLCLYWGRTATRVVKLRVRRET